MQLHIFVAGQERLSEAVPPEVLSNVLASIDARMDFLKTQGRVAVCLDSDKHPNLTYLLNRRMLDSV